MAVDNLKNIDGTWYVRVAIPRDVRSEFGNRTEFLKSLKTGRKSEAMVLRTKDLHEFKSLITKARKKAETELERAEIASQPVNVGFEELYEALDEIKQRLAGQQVERKNAFEESGYEDVHALREISSHHALLNQRAEEKALMGESLNPEMASLLSDLTLFESEPTKSFKRSEELLARLEKTMNLGSFKGYVGSREESKLTNNLISETTKLVKKHPLNEKNIIGFHAHEVKRKVTLYSVDRHVKRLRMLKEFIEKNKFEMDYESTRIYLETLQSTDNTKVQYICSFSAFYKYMFNDVDFRKEYPVNPFLNHALNKIRQGARKDEVRKAFTKEQVKNLYGNALSQEKNRLADLIRLGAYTGARIEEICQIKLDDLVEVDGVFCFDIKRSKTKAGERLVPVHSEIKPLVERLMEESKDGFLLKTNRGGKYGVKSKDMSTEFSKFKTALGYSRELVFHSFRHTMVTELERADVKNILVMSIVGPEVGGNLSMTFDRYSDGPTPVAKKEAIEKVKFDI